MSEKQNYRQIFARQKQCEGILKKACPNINHNSGIYFLLREEEGHRYGYIGKGKDVLRRMCSHLSGYQQRVDISLRKRGFYSKENEGGWKLNVLYFPEHLLDEKERYYIELYRKSGTILYNVESGGTINKEIIGERKAPKTYQDGLRQGDKRTKRKVKEYFEKYLDVMIRQPSNKIKEKKYNEFISWLKAEEN